MKHRFYIYVLTGLLLFPFIVGSKEAVEPVSVIYALSGDVASTFGRSVAGLNVFLEYSRYDSFDIDSLEYYYQDYSQNYVVTDVNGRFVIRDTFSSYEYGGFGWQSLRVCVVSGADTLKGTIIPRDSTRYGSVPSREVGCGATSRSFPSEEILFIRDHKVVIP